MSSQTELVVDFKDLTLVSISCPKCTTRVLLDMNDPEARVPGECPGCGRVYDPGFRSTLQAFQGIYRRLADPNGQSVQVRIALPELWNRQ